MRARHGARPPPSRLDLPWSFRYALGISLVSTRSPVAASDARPLASCQAALEVLPLEAVAVAARLAIRHEGDRTVYCRFLLPMHVHHRDGEPMRDRIVFHLVCEQIATVAELAAALGLSERTIYRAGAACR